ncbi:MAG: histidine-type phosphatase [Rhizomicrobium sp.]
MRNFHRLCAAVALLVGAAGAQAAPVLERVVIVERHGVRSPTKPPEAYAAFAAQPWPAWPAAPGELTDHGAEALHRIGAALREHYARTGLFAAQGCPSGVFLWADNADSRTLASAAAVAEGLSPDCAVPVKSAPPGDDDPLFHGAKLCRLDSKEAAQALRTRLARVVARNRAGYARANAALRGILRPQACLASADCALAGDNRVSDDGKLSGPLDTGSTLAENLLLEYAQGFARDQVGWGRAAGRIAAVMPLHNLYADLARRTPAVAAANATFLARAILAALGVPGEEGVPLPDGARFVLFLGHDTNLSNLSGLLGVRWRLPGQPDDTAPGTALAFELWRDHGVRTVRMKVYYQPLDAIRRLAPGLRVVPVGQRGLPLDAFARRLDARLRPDCRLPPAP